MKESKRKHSKMEIAEYLEVSKVGFRHNKSMDQNKLIKQLNDKGQLEEIEQLK